LSIQHLLARAGTRRPRHFATAPAAWRFWLIFAPNLVSACKI
jgi:hypothetical protein